MDVAAQTWKQIWTWTWKVSIYEDSDAGGGSIEEFDRVDISKGVEGMHYEYICETKELMDK